MIQITAFSFILLGALLLSSAFCVLEMRRVNIEKDHFWRLFPIMLVSGYLGARIFFVVFAWEQFERDPWSIFDVSQGGFTLFGALIGALIAVLVYAKMHSDLSLGRLLEAFAAPMFLLIGIGRWGDYFMQSGFGELLPDGFPHLPFITVYIDRLQDWRLGLFFIESLACLLIFAFLIYNAENWHAWGDGFLWGIILYGAVRTVLESMRQDSLFWGFVRVSQVCAVLLPLIAGFIFFKRIISVHGKLSMPEWILMAAMLASVGLGFAMEFNMGSGREGLFRMGLVFSMLTLCAELAFLYYRTPWKRKVYGKETKKA